MALILCIESGTNTCSVALGDDKGVVDVIESHDTNGNHAKNLTLFAKNILDKNGVSAKQLDAIAVSKGPGSYTGLRIGVSAAKGICYGAQIPLIAIGSLHSMALGAMHWLDTNTLQQQPDALCPMIDARRMEVYTQLYDCKLVPLSQVEAKILDDNSFQNILESKKVMFFGNGSTKAKSVISHPNALFLDDFKPSARYMISKAMAMLLQKCFEDVAYFEPFYLKDFIATIPKNKVLGD